MTIFMFPGQGSQKVGMGKELFADFPELVAKADAILGYSIAELCETDPQQQLNQTQYTQPALYVVNALTYLKKVASTGTQPDYVIGHSLGEYNALFAAAAFDFETGLKLVQRRGLLMSQATGGGMAAVLGLSEIQIQTILQQNELTNIDIANLNSPNQIVISGLQEDITRAAAIFKANGAALYVPLNVSGAFHSRYMQASQQQYAKFIEGFNFQAPVIPVIANVNARPYLAHDIKTNLVNQLASPVKWTESINYLLSLGVHDFVEVGPGNVLTKLAGQISKAYAGKVNTAATS